MNHTSAIHYTMESCFVYTLTYKRVDNGRCSHDHAGQRSGGVEVVLERLHEDAHTLGQSNHEEHVHKLSCNKHSKTMLVTLVQTCKL